MPERSSWSDRYTAWMNRFHARRAARGRAAAGFVSQPEPRTIGRVARGRQLCAGNFLFAGQLIEAPGVSIWDLPGTTPEFEAEVQGFVWLDDLAAAGDAQARIRAQQWTADWIARYGGGRGPGWTPGSTGRRLIRWINHALFMLNAQDGAASDAYYRSLGQQTVFLARRWRHARQGVPRFEALTGLVYAGLSLIGMENHVDGAVEALARECEDCIDRAGSIPSRNPEELLDIFTLLTWAAAALSEAGRFPPPQLQDAIARIAPTLRALRHADGGLARFHGGGRGIEGRLDAALAVSGVRGPAAPGLAMGYARLSAGRTSLIADVALPPRGLASAHASTLAFELTSGRRPVVVNCGAGEPFGAEWARAGRATASHSTLEIEGYSSSRLGGGARGKGLQPFANGPSEVRMHPTGDSGGTGITAGHNGYVGTHGLTHLRTLELSLDGRGIAGEDTLAAVEPDHHVLFDWQMSRLKLKGVPYRVRFHLHPDVDAEIDMGGSAVSLALKSGEIWIFRHDGSGELELRASVYLEKGRLRPRATKQIVLSARALNYANRIRWTLAKAQDTPAHIRDLERDDSDIMGETN